jgi:hypothetical protein
MADPHVITALVRKRAELAGLLRDLDRRRDSLQRQLAHVDETLKLFDYDGDPRTIKPVRPHRRLFRRNELRCMALDVMREAKHLLTYRDIAEAVIRRKGWTVDSELVERVTSSVGVSMRLRSNADARGNLLWERRAD